MFRLERLVKSLNPPVAIAMLVSSRPNSKCFAVITGGDKSARMLSRRSAKKFHRLARLAVRNQISQQLQTRNQMHARAHILGNERAAKPPRFKPRSQKVIVIHQRVMHSGRGKRRRKLRLPNALRQPTAARPMPEMLLDVISQPLNLLAPVLRRNRNQNRLVISAANHFHLPARHQQTQQLEIFRMRLLNPLQQTSRKMQTNANLRLPLEQLHKGKIRMSVGLLDDAIEVSDRLVSVYQKNKLEFRHGESWRSTSRIP